MENSQNLFCYSTRYKDFVTLTHPVYIARVYHMSLYFNLLDTSAWNLDKKIQHAICTSQLFITGFFLPLYKHCYADMSVLVMNIE